VTDVVNTTSIGFGLMDLTDTNAITINQLASDVSLGFSIALSKNTSSGLTQAFVLDHRANHNGGEDIPAIKVMDVTDTASTNVDWTVSEQIITPGIETFAPPRSPVHSGPWHSFATDNGLIIVGDGYRGITILDGN